MKINIPAKTFLVGEYSVLLGGAALGLATSPCFEVEYGDSEFCELHPDSAAARYLKQMDKKPKFKITDPYIGGFGRSTAEYLAAITLDDEQTSSKFHDIFKKYKTFHSGSGVDLAFQYFGMVCLADPIISFYQTFSWHFDHLDFFTISTGLKIKTHEHLANLDLAKLADLPKMSNKIVQSYVENREELFLSLMKDWCEKLKQYGLTHENSLKMKYKLESFEPIKLVKPCGALGADVLLVFFDKDEKKIVQNYLLENNYKIAAHSSNLTQGFFSSCADYRRENVD